MARDGEIYEPESITRMEAGDYIHILVESKDVENLERLFTTLEYVSEHDFFGDFVLDADAGLSDVALMYGIALQPDMAGKTAGEYLTKLFHQIPVVGDRASFGKLELVVMDMDHGKITRVGLKLRR